MLSNEARADSRPDDTVFQLNLTYLLSAQREASKSPRNAQIIYGLSDEAIEWLDQASVPELMEIAKSPVVIFKPTLPEQVVTRMRTQLRPTDRWVTAMHAALARSTRDPSGRG